MQELLKNLSPEVQTTIGQITAQFMEGMIADKCRFFDELNTQTHHQAIVFAGDSITEGFPIHELFPADLPLYNRGIAGMTSRQLLEHIDSLITGLDPQKVFLLIGTNDLTHVNELEEIAKRIYSVVLEIIKKCPETKIFLFSVYPVNRKERYLSTVEERCSSIIIRLNQLIKELVLPLKNVQVVDLFSVLSDSTGELKDEYTTDGLHISVAGYRKIADEILPFVKS